MTTASYSLGRRFASRPPELRLRGAQLFQKVWHHAEYAPRIAWYACESVCEGGRAAALQRIALTHVAVSARCSAAPSRKREAASPRLTRKK
jgi:hypothetical protein